MYEDSHANSIQAILDRHHRINVLKARGVIVNELDFPPIMEGRPQKAHKLPGQVVEPPQEPTPSAEPNNTDVPAEQPQNQ